MLLPLMILVLTGCASMVREEALPQEPFPSVAQAAKEVPALGELQQGKSELLNITSKKSPKVMHEDTSDYFEVVTVQGVQGEAFTIRADGHCTCLGMPKWIVNPRLYMFDEAGELVAESAIDPEVGPLAAVIEGTYPATGTYDLVVLAESKYHRKRTGAIPGYLNGVHIVTIPYTIREFGKVRVAIQE
jgi:hypothetical protein